MVILFKGPDNPLSNLFVIENKLNYRNHKFNSTEQAYQWEKAITHKKYNIANQIIATNNTFKQMNFGKQITTNTQWQVRKRKIMKNLLLKKASCCEEYKTALKNSGNETLVEDTNHPYWGRGRDGKGRNILGVLHCYVRSAILA